MSLSFSSFLSSSSLLLYISEENGPRFDTLKSESWNYQKAVRKIITHTDTDTDKDGNLNTEFIAIQKRCVIVNTLGNIFLVIFLSD
jgi:hypothetical protein